MLFVLRAELIRKRAIHADWLPKSPTRHAVRLDDPSKILEHDKVEVIGCRATSVLPGTSQRPVETMCPMPHRGTALHQ